MCVWGKDGVLEDIDQDAQVSSSGLPRERELCCYFFLHSWVCFMALVSMYLPGAPWENFGICRYIAMGERTGHLHSFGLPAVYGWSCIA